MRRPRQPLQGGRQAATDAARRQRCAARQSHHQRRQQRRRGGSLGVETDKFRIECNKAPLPNSRTASSGPGGIPPCKRNLLFRFFLLLEGSRAAAQPHRQRQRRWSHVGSFTRAATHLHWLFDLLSSCAKSKALRGTGTQIATSMLASLVTGLQVNLAKTLSNLNRSAQYHECSRCFYASCRTALSTNHWKKRFWWETGEQAT